MKPFRATESSAFLTAIRKEPWKNPDTKVSKRRCWVLGLTLGWWVWLKP